MADTLETPAQAEKPQLKQRKPRTKLTLKQRRFVNEYVKNQGNGTQAALKVYDTKDYFTGNAIAVENLQKPIVRDAVDARFQAVQELYQELSKEAVETTAELMKGAQNESVRLSAAKDIQDRAGHAPVAKTASVSQKIIKLDL